MASDIIEYKDYVFVKDIHTGSFDVELLGRQVACGASLQYAYRIADEDWDKRYPVEPYVYEDSECNDDLGCVSKFEVTGTVIRDYCVIEPSARILVHAESDSEAVSAARMKVLVEYGRDCLFRDINVKELSR